MDWILSKVMILSVLTSNYFIIYIISMLVDNFMGYGYAWSNGQLKSSLARVGAMRHLGTTAIVFVSMLVLYTFALDNYAVLVPVWFIIINLLSIIENYELLGGQLPAFVKEGIKGKKEKIDKGEI